jgi:hypothetical protein
MAKAQIGAVAPKEKKTISRLFLLITSPHGPHIKHHFSLLLYPIVAVETRLFAKPLLSNGCHCWLHSSYLEKICHNIYLNE